ncbi:MAG: glycosyltransferase family 1 protein [Candidatus Gallimonas sp.]
MEGEKIIRVAQVIGMAIDGGVEACVMNYYRAIDKSKVQFDFFVESTSSIIVREQIEKLGGVVILIPSYKNPFRYMRVLKKLFMDGKYDVVHSNMNVLSVFTLRAAKKAGIKGRIAHSHSTTNKKERLKNTLKNVLRPFSRLYATDYFACSEKAGRWLFGDRAFDRGKVTIVNNAIDLDKFVYRSEIRSEMRRDLGLDDHFVVGHVGRFMTQKNQKFLLEIFYEFQKRNPESKLLLLGDGPLRAALVQRTKELGIDSKVIFAGVQKQPERFYQAMDCFLLPSLYEGLPVVGIEAQINGLDCFFSDTITREVQVNENVEFLSLDLTAKDWAERISSAQKGGDRRCPKNFVGSKYDIVSEAEKLLQSYERIVGEGSV